jgi:branched-chain amino acid aminotransferase
MGSSGNISTRQAPSTKAPSAMACWMNGALVAPEQASVSVFDHGLLYGDGCFEGLRYHHRRPFRLHRHLQRLRRSLRALDIAIPFDDGELAEGVAACIDRVGLDAGYLRIVVTRGPGDLGLNPRHCLSPTVFIVSAPLALVSDERRAQGVALITSSIRRALDTGLDAPIKTLNYLHSILARAEANAAGADEALLLNSAGRVAECSAENIFIGSQGMLLTPPVIDGALAGITREALLELAAECGIPCREQSLTQYDLYTADECFICGSGAGLIPVQLIDGRVPATVPGPFYRQLSTAYRALVDRECRQERPHEP